MIVLVPISAHPYLSCQALQPLVRAACRPERLKPFC
jgi:hypothetical protein